MRQTRRAKRGAIASSRLTAKSQATIPASVRAKLRLKPGDTVVFEEGGQGEIRIRRAEPLDMAFLSALETALTEWNSDNDENAYGDL